MDQNNMNKPMEGGMTCKCPHHKMGPWMLILIGIVLLLGAFNILDGMVQMIIVGVALIVIGATKLGGANCKCCNHDKMKM